MEWYIVLIVLITSLPSWCTFTYARLCCKILILLAGLPVALPSTHPMDAYLVASCAAAAQSPAAAAPQPDTASAQPAQHAVLPGSSSAPHECVACSLLACQRHRCQQAWQAACLLGEKLPQLAAAPEVAAALLPAVLLQWLSAVPTLPLVGFPLQPARQLGWPAALPPFPPPLWHACPEWLALLAHM